MRCCHCSSLTWYISERCMVMKMKIENQFKHLSKRADFVRSCDCNTASIAVYFNFKWKTKSLFPSINSQESFFFILHKQYVYLSKIKPHRCSQSVAQRCALSVITILFYPNLNQIVQDKVDAREMCVQLLRVCASNFYFPSFWTCLYQIQLMIYLCIPFTSTPMYAVVLCVCIAQANVQLYKQLCTFSASVHARVSSTR